MRHHSVRGLDKRPFMTSIPSDDATRKQQGDTRDAAIAFLEDFAHMRIIAAQQFPERGDARRLSAVLRRLLIDNGGDLRKIAPCRIGRLEFKAKDTKPYVKAGPPFFFDCRGPLISFWPQRPTWTHAQNPELREGLPEITLTLDGFLKQPVMCFQGKWFRRIDLIKFTANIGSGVHSGARLSADEELIAKARHALEKKLVNGQHTIQLNRSIFSPVMDATQYDGGSLDPVHLSLVVTVDMMLASQSLAILEAYIHGELTHERPT